MIGSFTVYDPERGGRVYRHCDPLTGRVVAAPQTPAPGGGSASTLPGAGLQEEAP